MSISFERNGKMVNLQTFSNNEVVSYLSSRLNNGAQRFMLIAKPKFCNGVMVRYDDVYFIIHAERTYVELSFNRNDISKIKAVIEEISKWDMFSRTEKTFHVEIYEDNSYTVIFENGYATKAEYQRYFRENNIKFTDF